MTFTCLRSAASSNPMVQQAIVVLALFVFGIAIPTSTQAQGANAVRDCDPALGCAGRPQAPKQNRTAAQPSQPQPLATNRGSGALAVPSLPVIPVPPSTSTFGNSSSAVLNSRDGMSLEFPGEGAERNLCTNPDPAARTALSANCITIVNRPSEQRPTENRFFAINGCSYPVTFRVMVNHTVGQTLGPLHFGAERQIRHSPSDLVDIASQCFSAQMNGGCCKL